MNNAILIDIKSSADIKKRPFLGTRLLNFQDYVFNTDNIIKFIQIEEDFINEINYIKKENSNNILKIIVNKCNEVRTDFKKNIFEKKLSKVFKQICNADNYENFICLFSKKIRLNEKLLNYLKEIIKKYNVTLYQSENTMFKNDILNIDEYVKINVFDINKLRILILIKNPQSFDTGILLKYIEKYKFVDVLMTEAKDDRLLKSIDKINKEYGSGISVISRRNISNYDIYINFDFDKNIKEGFILKKKKLILNLNDSEDDIFNENVIAFEKNRSLLGHFKYISDFYRTEIGKILTDGV